MSEKEKDQVKSADQIVNAIEAGKVRVPLSDLLELATYNRMVRSDKDETSALILGLVRTIVELKAEIRGLKSEIGRVEHVAWQCASWHSKC